MSSSTNEFEKEVARLQYTKSYMEQILQSSKKEIDAANDKIREAMMNIDYLDSSDSFLNILTNSRFYELARSQKEGLEAIRLKPYFARIHFKRLHEPEEFLYIGKTSLFESETHEPIIVDWRSPIANVYYDGRLGDLTYEVRDEEHQGHLYAKRQYKIENATLLDFRDVDLTTNDELLQEALEGKSDVRLTEIVSTIQKEQNEVIRAHLKQPIVVQGAAGSGKTTIALHRISYFLYTMGEHFKAEKLMILAPNDLFIDYIKEVLPELGVGKIQQTTFTSYICNALQLNVKLVHMNDVLEQKIKASSTESTDNFNIDQLKGSASFQHYLDRILAIEEAKIAEQFEDVFIEKYRIIRASHLKKLFLIEFKYMPIEKRLERIKAVIETEVKRKAKSVLHSLALRYEEAIERTLNGVRDATKRKALVTKFLDERDARIPKIKTEMKQTTKAYMRRFNKITIKKLYRSFLTDENILNRLIPEWDQQTILAFISHHQKERYTVDDLACLYYLHAKIKGIDDRWKMSVVVIDEVQDYSMMQLIALKEGLETDMFTMVGDLAQGIHSYRSITNWEEVLSLFPRANFTTLQKSYRTTIEIMDLANKILMKLDENLPLVEPVVRHGKNPSIMRSKAFNPKKIVEIVTDIKTRHPQIALICKTTDEAKKAFEQLQNHLKVQLLTEHSTVESENELLIVPSHLAKGLEFDAVIISIVDEPYKNNTLDRKLLYVALTRAMHELILIGPNKAAFLLD